MPRRFLMLAAVAPVSVAAAQLHTTRNIMVAPVGAEVSGGAPSGWFPAPRFFIEAARGWGSTGGEQAWNIKWGGLFQITLGEQTALVGLFGHELTSNPYNDLGYNPRGAIWDENALLVRRTRAGDWHGGVFFRCRHELDNKDGADERLPDSLRVPTARILGVGGIMTGLTTRELHAGRGWRLRGFVRVEGYFHRKDDRSPNLRDGPDWLNALGAAGVGARVSRPVAPALTIYARGWATSMLLARSSSAGRLQLNGRAEIGIRGGSTRGGMDLHLAYERFFDDLSRPVPQRNRALFAGLRVTPGEFF